MRVFTFKVPRGEVVLELQDDGTVVAEIERGDGGRQDWIARLPSG